MAADIRAAVAQALVELGEVDERIFVIECDLDRAGGFGARFPGRLLRLGVSEANAIGMAAGLALAGKVPFVATMAPFIAMRACEQVRVDVCYNKTNVKLIGDGAGLSNASAGPTHHAIEDIAIMRSMPNMTVVAPADAREAAAAVKAAAALEGPVYIRIGRGNVPDVPGDPAGGDRAGGFRIGKAISLREGDDLTLVASGNVVVPRALEVASELERRGVSAGVLNLHTVKPIDVEVLLAAARKTGRVVVLEEHTILGGVGSAVAEVLSRGGEARILRVGIGDRYALELGEWGDLLDVNGLSVSGILAAIAEWMGW